MSGPIDKRRAARIHARMLAYTFWHWPREDASEYERHLAEFFQVMEEDKPQGYLGGLTLRHGAAP